MNNIIATSTHVLTRFPIHECIKILKNMGYTGVEIWYGGFLKQTKEGVTTLDKIKKALEETGLKGVIHCPLRNLLAKEPYKYNICSKDKKLRKESIKINLDAIKFCKELGFHLFNAHPGATDKAGEEVDDEYWLLQEEGFQELVNEAEKNNIIIAFEMMEDRPREFVKSPVDILKIINKIESEHAGASVTLDVVHAITKDPEYPFLEIKELGNLLRHIHISGYCGKKTHCPFKLTHTPKGYMRELMKELLLDYDGFLTIEGTIKGLMEETPENELNAVKDNLKFVNGII